MHKVMLFAQPRSQATWGTRFYVFFYNLVNVRCIVDIYILLYKPFFLVFSSMGRCSLQYVWELYLSEIFWTSTCLIIRIWVFNQTLSHFFSRIYKFIIRLEEIFHSQICINFSACYKKSKNSDGTPGCSPFTLRTKLGFIPAIMPQGIVIIHRPPVHVMIQNNFRILELGYIPTNHHSILLLTLRHSQTQKGWHHHNIAIRIL